MYSKHINDITMILELCSITYIRYITLHLHYIYITFTLHLHYIYTTFTLHLHYIYITFLHYIYITFTLHLHYISICITFTLHLGYNYITFTWHYVTLHYKHNNTHIYIYILVIVNMSLLTIPNLSFSPWAHHCWNHVLGGRISWRRNGKRQQQNSFVSNNLVLLDDLFRGWNLHLIFRIDLACWCIEWNGFSCIWMSNVIICIDLHMICLWKGTDLLQEIPT